jgi:hypothetical protein
MHRPRARAALVEELHGPFGIRLTHGLARLTADSVTGVPTDGAAFYLFGARAERAGLLPTDIIIGVDEWRVRSRLEFDLAMRLRLDSQVRFTVWRNNRFFQIDSDVPEHTLASDMADLTERPGPARRAAPPNDARLQTTGFAGGIS